MPLRGWLMRVSFKVGKNNFRFISEGYRDKRELSIRWLGLTGQPFLVIITLDDITLDVILSDNFSPGGTCVDLADLGRFSDPALFILTSLADGAKHGYAMMQDIETLFGVRLGPGTLYGALARLEQHRLIEPLESEDRRRPYRLTPTGATFLRAQLTNLEAVAAIGRRRLASL